LCQRDALLNTRTQERNRLHALRQSPEVFATILDRYEAHITFLNQQVEGLDQEIQNLLQSDPQWADAAHYLLSIKGIGPITAAWLLVATLNFTTCQTAEQLVAFAGLAPYRRQSGAHLNQSRRIGHGGHARLRAALYMAAVAAVRSNPRIRQFYQRLLERGKSKKTALCACARKLIHIAWAVVTKQSVFDPTYGLLEGPALSLS
jgi:transposase